MQDDRGTLTRSSQLPADAEIVERVCRGDVQAYGTLVERYEHALFAAVLPIIADSHAAQDVVQDVFVQCYFKLSTLRDASRFGGWLMKVGGREAVRVAQRGSRMRIRPSELTDDNAPAVAESNGVLLDDERARLLAAVRRLPSHERVAVSLRYFEGHAVQEVARIIGRPVGTITKQLTRAIERLRSDLASAGSKYPTHTERKTCQTNESKLS